MDGGADCARAGRCADARDDDYDLVKLRPTETLVVGFTDTTERHRPGVRGN